MKTAPKTVKAKATTKAPPRPKPPVKEKPKEKPPPPPPPQLPPPPDESSSPSPCEDTTDTDSKPSPRWHDKCITGYDSARQKKVKKKTRKYPDEVVKFVEGVPETGPASFRGQAYWKSYGDIAQRNAKYTTQVRHLEHKYIQCNINKDEDDSEISLPEEIKPLLISVTFLLHELKQRTDNKNQDELCNVISKIATLLTELSRRPIKRYDHAVDQLKPFDEAAEKLVTILKEHNGPGGEQYEKLVQEVKQLQAELIEKDSEVNYVKEQIKEERARLMSNSTDIADCLRNSLLKNQSLKAEIKYNKAQCRKYARIMTQKENLKQKSHIELNNLRRKCDKLEQSIDKMVKAAAAAPKIETPEPEVFPGGSVTKYIKSKVVQVKKTKRNLAKPKDKNSSGATAMKSTTTKVAKGMAKPKTTATKGN